MDIDFWIGFAVPAGTPQPAIDKLHAAIVESLSLPDVKKRIGEFGITALGSTPAQATALLNTEIDRWSAVIQAAGIKAD
jgi:tripartite-type tricarboxylate transporter receptor subunit TctC